MPIIRIKLTYRETGQTYYWTVRRVPRAYNVVLGKKPRVVAGWEFTDHENCTRFSEGNWFALVDHFRLVANNYGMDCAIS